MAEAADFHEHACLGRHCYARGLSRRQVSCLRAHPKPERPNAVHQSSSQLVGGVSNNLERPRDDED